jgi:vacuolar iron transporter family protein
MKKHLKEFVYGATDGTVTTFAIIAGTIGANLSPVVVLLLGVSNVLADGFSMAASNYLSTRSESDMLGEEKKYREPLKAAFVTFVSFVVIGSIPILPFILARMIPALVPHQFLIASCATALAFIIIGAVRGIVAKQGVIIGAVETLLIGGVAASIAYGVGSLLDTIV